MRHVILYTIFLSRSIFGNGQFTAESEEFWDLGNLPPELAAPKLSKELSHFVFRKDNRQRNRTETEKENFKLKGIYNKEDDKATIAYKRAQDEELDAVENIEDEVQDNASARRGNDGIKQDETYVDQNYYYENRKDKNVEGENYEEGSREAEEYEASEEEFQERAAELVSSPKKIVQVNMKELVERVKKKILMDLKREAKKEEQIEKTRSSRPSNNHRIRLTTTNYKPNSQKKVRPPHLQNKKKAKPVKSPQYVLPNRQSYKKIQNKKVAQEYIEQTDLFDTVNLQAKDKRDQYQEYVIPPKEYDAYESEETVTNEPTNNRKHRNYKNPVESQKPRQLRISDKQLATDHEQQNYDSRQTRTSGHYLKKIQTISQHTYHKNNIHETPQSDAAETTTDIFEDNSMTKRRTTQELKARTENIGGPSEEDTIVKNLGGKDSKKDHLGTDIPTRQTYKMSSPDYYHKLPRVAEKYNFDEPIPEKDREEEDTRQIYKNPGAMINKKFKIE